MAKSTKYSWSLLVQLLIFGNAAWSAPLKTTTSLPLTGNDIAQAQATLRTQLATEQFTYFIKSLDVYPDHQNPTDINEIENRAHKKVFYVTPFFQASEERPFVGSQEIADLGLTIIAEAYDLVTAFDFELLKINQFEQEKEKKAQALDKLRHKLPDITDPLARKSTENLISQIETEITNIDESIHDLEDQASRGISETSMALKRQVVNQIQLKLSFLGVIATVEETTLLDSEDANKLRQGITSIIARATGLGQFGYRNVIYEAGYTRQQRDWIALYRIIRPDVAVGSLTTNTVYARSTALTAKNNGQDDQTYFLGDGQIVNAPRLFLAINGGSRGECGNTRSCNVTIEFTWLGATMAKTARSGAIAMPVFFEADVAFMQPDFDGTVSCDSTNGFSARGRADVKDGAVIYDGDVYNMINYSAIEDGSCSYSIVKGDRRSAAYYALKSIYENYMNLKMQRAAKARDEKDRYKEYVDRELAYHASRSQNDSNFDFWSLGTWTTALGGTWGAVASFVIGGARSFYWHTRIEDSTTKETVRFDTTIKESNVQTIERMAFDGFTMLCWKNDGSDAALAACPAANLLDYQNSADTDLGKSQHLCQDAGVTAECIDRANDNQRNPNTDENGVIEDPWA